MEPIREPINHERIFARQLQTYAARVLTTAFRDRLITRDQVDPTFVMLEQLQATQIQEMKKTWPL